MKKSLAFILLLCLLSLGSPIKAASPSQASSTDSTASIGFLPNPALEEHKPVAHGTPDPQPVEESRRFLPKTGDSSLTFTLSGTILLSLSALTLLYRRKF